ncbi:putative two-component response regulator [Bacillus sp. J14TS2]|uniref:response regulator transcription factor n=1 Tax=Bacillus sp. J14TS2 TaxID=2807188 RepID=UPI001B006E7B|nr:response regulator [Bacillus sp. J14TS2]GIN71614.1 putative two-component response regulator [Bacillus sp. J14TS2]
MYKILLVDDEQEIRFGLKNYFPWNNLGFTVTHDCENGQQALEFLKENPIDVVLTDIRMPVLDGIDLAREVKKREFPIQIIFLSGYKDFHYAQNALKYGVRDYIIKPGKYEEIEEVFTILKKDLDQEWNNARRNQSANSYSENITQTIKKYTEEHYSEVTLEDLSQLLKMSPNYISTFFKEKTGINFSTYLAEIRMKKAAELLIDYHYKTYEISHLLGYNNPKSFTRMFKKYYGVSPREYRNQRAMSL